MKEQDNQLPRLPKSEAHPDLRVESSSTSKLTSSNRPTSKSTTFTFARDVPFTPFSSEVNLNQSTKSPIEMLPTNPDDVSSQDEMFVRNYLNTDKIGKNQSEVRALLKAVYLTNPEDFPKSPRLSMIKGDLIRFDKADDTQPKSTLPKQDEDSGQKYSQQKKINISDSKAIIGNNVPKGGCCKDEECVQKPSCANTFVDQKNTNEVYEKSTNDLVVIKKSRSVIPASSKNILDGAADEDSFRPNKKPFSAEGPKIWSEQNVVPTPLKNTCTPKTCSQLNVTDAKKRRMICCDAKTCPIKDPTTSTYNFLMKVKACCGTRGCQLAAKICDIYEPLVPIDSALLSAGLGDSRYHYLAVDGSTGPEEIDAGSEEHSTDTENVIEEHPASVTPVEARNFMVNLLLKDQMLEERESEEEIKSQKLDKKVNTVGTVESIEGSLTPLEEYQQQGRRVSTVSWSVPSLNAEPTASEQKLIREAFEEADNFRQTIEKARGASVFGDVVRESIYETLPQASRTHVEPKLERRSSSELFFKSKLDFDNYNSDHKQKCWPAFLSKFKRKKKKSLPDDDDGFDMPEVEWASEKRKTIQNIVSDKDHEIKTMLNKV